MALDSSVRTDNRLDEMPMLPVACRTCGARVLVRKSTWIQTSVQWNADATDRCAERAEARRCRRTPAVACSWCVRRCASPILDTVRHGELSVVDD